ncbi:M81 family metallopeptidase, partial [Klebsiella pneumoniae]|nr:M81 family metallopeptidase [Klebsiella pneumoniae]
MTRIGIAGFFHETNSFALEANDEPTALLHVGDDILRNAHPRDYIGGFVDGARRPGVEFVPIADVNFLN